MNFVEGQMKNANFAGLPDMEWPWINMINANY